HEVARAGGAAIEITFFRRAVCVLATRRSRDLASSGRQCFEDRLQMVEGLLLAADHQTVTSLGAPDAARGADINITDAFFIERLCATHVVFEMRIAAVNDDVAAGHKLRQYVDDLFSRVAGGNHDPDGAWFLHLFDQVLDGSRAPRAFALHLFNAVGVEVKDEAFMPAAHQTANHVGAHASQANHSQLH